MIKATETMSEEDTGKDESPEKTAKTRTRELLSRTAARRPLPTQRERPPKRPYLPQARNV